MVKKTRYCTSYYNKDAKKKGMIENYLSEEIDFLLTPAANQLLEVDVDEVYISNSQIEEIESTLGQYLNYSICDKTLFFTGLTGSGKTMILRHVFKYSGMGAYIYGKCLVIPFSFDNIHGKNRENVEGCFRNMILTACDILEETFLLNKASDFPQDFYKSIKESRNDNLQMGSAWPRPSIDERLTNYEREDPLAFASSLLKYYLNQEGCTINNVLFLVDDIEGIGDDLEIVPIKVAYEVMICMENQRKKRQWSTKCIIACRHYVYRYAAYNQLDDFSKTAALSKQNLEAYSPTDILQLGCHLPLIDIIEKRYTVIKDKKPDVKWKIALEVVRHVLIDIDANIGQFIVHLNVNNLREAFVTLKMLIYNRRWVQRDPQEKSDGAFSITSADQFNTTSVNLLRALAMDENVVYCSDESIIPNLLHNEIFDNMDFIVILTAKYFEQFKSANNWSAYLNIEDFYDTLHRIFKDNEYFLQFKKAVEYLIMKRILLRGINQTQEDTNSITYENVHLIKKVYVSPVLNDLFDYLRTKSVLFEMYMDDVWKDNSDRSNPPKAFRMYDNERSLTSFKYMETLINKEREIRNCAKNHCTLNLYYDTFGNDILCEYLLAGLENSYNIYFRSSEIDFSKDIIKNRIDRCRKLIDENLRN